MVAFVLALLRSKAWPFIYLIREPQLPGYQGHEVVSRKGETAMFCLTGEGKEPVEPITPNGIVMHPVVVD